MLFNFNFRWDMSGTFWLIDFFFLLMHIDNLLVFSNVFVTISMVKFGNIIFIGKLFLLDRSRHYWFAQSLSISLIVHFKKKSSFDDLKICLKNFKKKIYFSLSTPISVILGERPKIFEKSNLKKTFGGCS